MKYVMLEVSLKEVKKKVPIIFPDFMIHEDIAKAAVNILSQHHNLYEAEVVSAGDLNLYVESVSGRSTTLGIKADSLDREVINNYEYCHGMKE